jgi:hypothetical protein
MGSPRLLTTLTTLPLLALTACAGAPSTADVEASPAAATTAQDEQADGDDDGAAEVAAPRPRLVMTYDGGVLVVDALTLEVVDDLELPGYNRLGPFGDDRHVFVNVTDGQDKGFRVLDVGSWSEAHGDHAHHYAGDPHLTGIVVPADAPGHAIPHGGVTTLFDDATGDILVLDRDELLAGTGEPERHASEAAHHGFALVMDDGSLVATLGDEEARTGLRVLDADGAEVARNEDCPGVHGEGVVQGDVVVAGCEDGVLVQDGAMITKLQGPAAFGRIGNLYVSPTSPVAVGDHKADPEQGLTLTQVALVDTTAPSLQVVELPDGIGYTWRGVGRGADDEGLLLGTDGALHVLDVATGDVTASHPVIEPWEAPDAWQKAHPALLVLDGMAYVTDPARRQIHAVDPVTGEVWRSGDLPAAPNETIGTRG